MAYGDTHFEWVGSGSTATSANTAHGFFGAYGGLSDLNAAEVIHVQACASVYEYRLAPSAVITNNTGYKVSPTSSWNDIPPMRASNANAFQFMNEISGSNASAMWVVWRRASL
jgi:hypothetical protein